MPLFFFVSRSFDAFADRKVEDTTKLISTLKATNLVNIVSMLYGMLHKDASTPVKSINHCDSHNTSHSASSSNVTTAALAKTQTDSTLELSRMSIQLLNQMFLLDLNMVQVRRYSKKMKNFKKLRILKFFF
jgi:transaldolase